MKLADTAVEFSEFQHNVETKIQELHDDPMTFTPCIINTVNAVIDNKIDTMIETKFQDLPALVTKELQKSTSSLLHPVIDTSPTVAKLLRNVQDLQLLPRQPTQIPRLSGFHQHESKDFHTFHDTIQSHFSTVTTSSMIFPKYRDITQKFTFYHHLCSQETNPKLNPGELHQSKLNYGTFGSGLRQFILNPKTISKDSASDSYLQLLSLRHEQDGFLPYKNFIFLRSPHLDENLLTTGMKSASWQ